MEQEQKEEFEFHAGRPSMEVRPRMIQAMQMRMSGLQPGTRRTICYLICWLKLVWRITSLPPMWLLERILWRSSLTFHLAVLQRSCSRAFCSSKQMFSSTQIHSGSTDLGPPLAIPTWRLLLSQTLLGTWLVVIECLLGQIGACGSPVRVVAGKGYQSANKLMETARTFWRGF